MDAEHLIETVHKFPCLWNTTAIEYRDQELKDAAWIEVMKETEMSSVKEVKQKWKKLRDSYRDALKRSQDGGAGGGAAGGAGGRAPWKHAVAMAFLQPHMGARRKPPPPPRSTDDDEASEAEPAPPPRAAKRPPEPYAPDPLDIFFNGMCQAAKRLPFASQLKIKRTLFEAVTGAEEALLAEQHSLAALWAAQANSDSSDDDRRAS